MKIVKIAASARIKPNIPTYPRAGRLQLTSGSGMTSGSVLMKPSFYSYFQSGSSGCFKSHNGRRLLTAGVTAKLYTGGGEGVNHSSVHASHGSLPASLPRKYDHSRFQTKTNMPSPWNITPMEVMTFKVSQPRPASYV